jgi:hypothetical protein
MIQILGCSRKITCWFSSSYILKGVYDGWCVWGVCVDFVVMMMSVGVADVWTK